MIKPGRHIFDVFLRQCLIVVIILVFIGSLSGKLYSQSVSTGVDLSAELGSRYFDAVDFLLRNPWMADTLKQEKIQPALAYGIVFPELVKYSALRDVMETGATKMLYVQSGRKYGHYSVGRFQMTPAFAELLERTVVRQKLSSEKFNMSNTPKARGERTRRMDSPEWQLRYLVMFIRIMDKRFSHIKWKSDEDKVRFYATGYSVGFNRDERSIRRMMTTRSIIRKSKKVKSKLRSGDIALWFYTNDGYRFSANVPGSSGE